MRNFIIIVAISLGLIAAGVIAKYQMRPDYPDILTPRIGEIVQNFAFESLDGANYALYDFMGRPVIVHFWATWCAPCVVEFPELADYASNNPDVTILAVSADVQTDKIDQFVDENVPNKPDNMIIIHNRTNDNIQEKFGTYQLPETYVLTDKMIVSEKIIGAYKGWSTFQILP